MKRTIAEHCEGKERRYIYIEEILKGVRKVGMKGFEVVVVDFFLISCGPRLDYRLDHRSFTPRLPRIASPQRILGHRRTHFASSKIQMFDLKGSILKCPSLSGVRWKMKKRAFRTFGSSILYPEIELSPSIIKREQLNISCPLTVESGVLEKYM